MESAPPIVLQCLKEEHDPHLCASSAQRREPCRQSRYRA
jgi:hypothetical protein